jgi:Spy/CpxP family protein refolding chaperone
MFNRTKVATAALALAVAGAGTVALANEGEGPRFRGRGAGFYRGLRALDLTDDQKAALRSIMQEQREASEPQREQIRAVRQQIHQLLDGGKADPAEVGRLTIQAHTLGLQLREQHKRAFEKFEAQLTPEQKAKLDQMKQEREQRGFGRRGPWRDHDSDDDEPGPGSSF